jgi:hypothetical protein
LVGFGNSGTPRPDGTGFVENTSSAGVRRTATNVIGATQVIHLNNTPWFTPCILADLDAPNGNTLPPPYNRDWFGDGGPSANEGGLMAGDSGGAWMVNVGGQFQLAGVSNYIFYDDTVAPATDPNPYFAYGFSGCSAADLTDPTVRAWINGVVPEPASTTALILGIGGLLLRRRTKR